MVYVVLSVKEFPLVKKEPFISTIQRKRGGYTLVHPFPMKMLFSMII
jgi:hypothetical protein